jgi:aldehyde:ferredoxin oxidoreductase
MVICIMPPINTDTKLELLKAVTGWDTGWVDVIKACERVRTLMRLFNVREGFTKEDDMLPERFLQNKSEGPLATKPILNRAQMEEARGYYYTYFGWDANGVPMPEKLAELDIE